MSPQQQQGQPSSHLEASGSLIRSFPLVAGLTSVSDVINHLPPPVPSTLLQSTLFPSSFLPSSQLPPEPALTDFLPQLAAFHSGVEGTEAAWEAVREAVGRQFGGLELRGEGAELLSRLGVEVAPRSPEEAEMDEDGGTREMAEARLMGFIRLPSQQQSQRMPAVQLPIASTSTTSSTSTSNKPKSTPTASPSPIKSSSSAAAIPSTSSSSSAKRQRMSDVFIPSSVGVSSPDPLSVGLTPRSATGAGKHRGVSSSSSSISPVKGGGGGGAGGGKRKEVIVLLDSDSSRAPSSGSEDDDDEDESGTPSRARTAKRTTNKGKSRKATRGGAETPTVVRTVTGDLGRGMRLRSQSVDVEVVGVSGSGGGSGGGKRGRARSSDDEEEEEEEEEEEDELGMTPLARPPTRRPATAATTSAPASRASEGTTTKKKKKDKQALLAVLELVEDVFAADDALAGDTSRAALGGSSQRAQGGGGGEGMFEQTTEGGSEGEAKLGRETLEKMAGLLGRLKGVGEGKGKGKGRAEDAAAAATGGGEAGWVALLFKSTDASGGASEDGEEGQEEEDAEPKTVEEWLRLLRLLGRGWEGINLSLSTDWEGPTLSELSKEVNELEEQTEEKDRKGKGKKGVKKPQGGKGRRDEEGDVGMSDAPAAVADEDELVMDDDEEQEEEEEPCSEEESTSKRPTAKRGNSSSTKTPTNKSTSKSKSKPSSTLDPALLLSLSSLLSRTSHLLSSALTALRFLSLDLAALPLATRARVLDADYLAGLLGAVRGAWGEVVAPCLAAAGGSMLGRALEADAGGAGKELGELMGLLKAGLEELATLGKRQKLTEMLVNELVGVGLGVFFSSSSSGGSSTGAGAGGGGKGKAKTVKAASGQGQGQETQARPLKRAAGELVRMVWVCYPSQKPWILDELLGLVLRSAEGALGGKKKGGYALRTGTSIGEFSALVLQLVGSVGEGMGREARRRLAAAAGSASGGKGKDEGGAKGKGKEEQEEEDPVILIQRTLLDPSLLSAGETATTILRFLLQKACKGGGKAASGSNEQLYRGVFDELVRDLVKTVWMPEWPGSEVLLTVAVGTMTAYLRDTRNNAEINAAKALALDHLGSICTLLRDLQLKTSSSPEEAWVSLPKALAAGDIEALRTNAAKRRQVLNHLEKTGQHAAAAGGMMRAQAAREFSKLYAAAVLAEEEKGQGKGKSRGGKVGEALRELAVGWWDWDEGEEDVFGRTPDEDQQRIDSLSLLLSSSGPLASSYSSILLSLLSAGDSSSVSFRSKALKGVGQLVHLDPSLFHAPEVKRMVEARMLDSSPAVRDSALELVGKYVVTRRELALEYLPRISDRVSDTGLGVRKRAIKLLKQLYYLLPDEASRESIARRLIWRVGDEDEGIKDLTVDTINDLWFIDTGAGASIDVSQTAGIIVLVAAPSSSSSKPAPVDECLKLIFARHAERNTKPPTRRLQALVDVLMDRLVDDQELGPKGVVGGVKTIWTLLAAGPGMLSPAKAQGLLPYLKGASSPEEQATVEYLLKIFRITILAHPKTAFNFAKSLQGALLPLINKPNPQGSLTTLQELVACFCTAVRNQTLEFASLITVFRACYMRLKDGLAQLRRGEQPDTRVYPLLGYLTALLCQYGDLDSTRASHEQTVDMLNRIEPGVISDAVYSVFVALYQSEVPPQVKHGMLTSLGFLFRAYPTIMLRPSSTVIMDKIWVEGQPQTQALLLRILLEFLTGQGVVKIVREEEKEETKVDIDELVGNVEGFADSGVASAVCQRYINEILSLTLSPQPQLQRQAVDILSIIVKSGFSHPLSLSPTLVALSGNAPSAIAAKTNGALASMYQKHASLLATRFVEAVRASWSYAAQLAVAPAVPRGFDEETKASRLDKWYALQREKRAVKIDLLKTLCRRFEVQIGDACSAEDVSMVRFLAEALSTLEYKTQEEPMLVIALAGSALAGSGAQVWHRLEGTMQGSLEDVLGGVAAAGDRMAVEPSTAAAAGTVGARLDPELVRQSQIAGVALLLRDHLKTLYSISDAKMAKFTVGKKSPVGDKAASRKQDAPVALDAGAYDARMPLAMVELQTEDQLVAQRDAYVALIAQDGEVLQAGEEGQDEDEEA